MIVSYQAHQDSISQLEFHPWYPIVLTGSYDDSLKLWSAQNRSLICQYTVYIEYVNYYIESLPISI